MATPDRGDARTTFASSLQERALWEEMAAKERISLSEWIRRGLNERASAQLLRDALAARAATTGGVGSTVTVEVPAGEPAGVPG